MQGESNLSGKPPRDDALTCSTGEQRVRGVEEGQVSVPFLATGVNNRVLLRLSHSGTATAIQRSSMVGATGDQHSAARDHHHSLPFQNSTPHSFQSHRKFHHPTTQKGNVCSSNSNSYKKQHPQGKQQQHYRYRDGRTRGFKSRKIRSRCYEPRNSISRSFSALVRAVRLLRVE